MGDNVAYIADFFRKTVPFAQKVLTQNLELFTKLIL